MITFPENIKFKYPWRKYQERVLNELSAHLTDRHLHVIAPPGSGKTVLGLEVVLRLNQPTLILAPTLAIRNQWIQRFCELFLQVQQTPDWISRDIRQPRLMTVVTYQGLHAACSNLQMEEAGSENEEETEERPEAKYANQHLESVVEGLQAQGVKTIVADEAHHLKNEWWQTLIKVKERLDPVVIGLTATPPYDVSALEWQRYIALNGPVDTEISVPELVIENDLCPHQDYVYFSQPTAAEYENIALIRQNIETAFYEIKRDGTLLEAIESHPVMQNPSEHLEWIYNNLACYSSALIFMNANARIIPYEHRKVIGDDSFDIPEIDYAWTATLLDFYLYKGDEHFAAYEEHRKNLETKLRRYGVIEKRQINFFNSKQVTGLLTSSINKLNSIKTIVDFEYSQLGAGLRMVILTDYIRKEFYPAILENHLDLTKIGVMPIFEKLRRENPAGVKIGVLTGSVIILPVAALSAFEKRAQAFGISQVSTTAVPFDHHYVFVHQTTQIRQDIIHLVTTIFQEGEIEVLIGTKSLLGEGWDAPAINALILASFVGSFVLSNQMRGRAIRTQNTNADKTGNIWHLVCIDPLSPTGGEDFDLMKRRFRSFVGVSFKEEPGIENGFDRLNIPENLHQPEDIEGENRVMFQLAGDRASLRDRWDTALATGVTLVEEIKIPFPESRRFKPLKKFYFTKTIAYLIAQLISGLMTFGSSMFNSLPRAMRNFRTPNDFLTWIKIIGIFGLVIFGRQLIKVFSLYIKYRDIAKDIHQIGRALLHTLVHNGTVHTSLDKLEVKSSVDDSGAVFCHLEGGTTFERSTFINALQELIGPVDNPRYVIIRKSVFSLVIKQKDYHSVPEIIGRNKSTAQYFCEEWNRLVGNGELVFTRTFKGRKLLLQSRIKSLAAQMDKKTEHVSKWRR